MSTRVEASALPTRLTRSRAPLSAAFLRLRSDEQLVALFRAGSEDAFSAIHDRYRARLLVYARQMLNGGTSDPEDALQDVFIRAYRALRANDRPVTLRAWLYRIAHNRCIDELRRPCPFPSELAADAQPAFGPTGAAREPPEVAEGNAALARLVADVQTLPSQQRSALLMRELQGLSYAELGAALGISAPAVKSLLLRARTGLIDMATARDTPCLQIRDELVGAADRSVRISARARRHCAECASCAGFRDELKRVRRGFAALTPSGPLGQLGMLLGIGGGGGGAAAAGGGAAAAGGGAAAAGGGALAAATAAKIAVAVCCAALITTAGRAVIAPSAPAHAPVESASSQPAAAALSRSVAGVPATSRAPAATRTAPPARTGQGGGAAAPLAATGSSGTSGASGPTGSSAATGASGASGDSGPTGATGTTAPGVDTQTPTATAPVNGIGGASAGVTSPAGPSGASGATGTTGATGATGAAPADDGHHDFTDDATGPSGPTATAAAAGDPPSPGASATASVGG